MVIPNPAFVHPGTLSHGTLPPTFGLVFFLDERKRYPFLDCLWGGHPAFGGGRIHPLGRCDALQFWYFFPHQERGRCP